MHRVFVYGSLRKGLGNHDYLRSQQFITEAEITEGFCMVNLGYFPGICHCDSEMAIQGEVYEVDGDTLKSLDRLEGHPTFYKRKEVETTGGPCWVYVLPSCFMDKPIVTSGNWLDTIKRSNV